MAHPIDLHVGQRLRQRRCLLGMTQQRLAEAVGIKFQQIQKYESGANRVSASRLWALANALEVSVSYFFDDLSHTKPNGAYAHGAGGGTGEEQPASIEPEVLSEKETIDLVRAYYGLSEEPRRRLLDLAKTLAGAA
ncbi:helix-turn-helix domain-containing protein [Aquisalinus flavus]|uniref:Transcriptional regulator n=1 Tax=Aquisalinus flavus TaxID=1526572 RepID=A0A8J2V5T8_9PROT|nr:helix-turn-helix transcriptional regulator [Aquisalinus flavus]MBD0426109.1 helix-turn-helix transcriptional regulator [Aquisalinus flavus]UNE48306.1 helix-turn-helix transcriptional regulator [Aquisalinus flavus]GGD10566.1 transcriptional regulator [Aquisalinus flavus]